MQNIQSFLFQECGIKLDIVPPETTLKLKSKATMSGEWMKAHDVALMK